MTDSTEPLSRIGRYEVRGHLGEGGCGQVFRGFDPLLKRTVALKRVRQRIPGEDRRRELLREARALSALQHPRVAAIFDVLEEPEELWLVEEFVAGESLRSRLGRPVDDATFRVLAADCCEALEYAAERGILHCDFKPENVMLTPEGRAKVLDFGLAQRMTPSGDSSDTFLPAVGRSSGGTPAYMAPEVIVGRAAGVRSDIFSLGVVFYELLTGRNPFRRESSERTITSVLEDEPEDPRERVPGIPAELAELVLEMLRKDVHHRPESMTAVRERLERVDRIREGSTVLVPPRPEPEPGPEPGPAPPAPRRHRAWVAAAVLAAALVATAVVVWQRRAPDVLYLVVEPFEDLSASGEGGALAAGLTDRVRVELSALGELYVVEPRVDPGSGLVLQGSVQREGGTVQVTYRFVERPKGRIVSGGTVEAPRNRLLQLQGDVALGARAVLVARYGIAMEEPVPPVAGVDPAAYERYLRGRGHLASRSGSDELDAAIGHFEAALEAAPGWVPALAGLGEALWLRYEATADPATVARAEEFALEAVRLDPESGEARETLGTVLLGTGRAARAEREFRRALEIDPRSVPAARGVARARQAQGDEAGAEAAYLGAIAARPDDWLAIAYYGSYLASTGRDAEAVAQFERVARLTPRNPVGWSSLGAVRLRTGDVAGAIEALRTSIDVRPTAAGWSNLAVVLEGDGRLEEAAAAFRGALELNDRDFVIWANLAATLKQSGVARAEWEEPCLRAISLGEARLEVNPSDPEVLAKLAQLHSECGTAAAAERYAEDAIVNTEDPRLLVAAAGALATVGEGDRACEVLARAVERGLDPAVVAEDGGLPDLKALECFGNMASERTGS